jgi:hypothetical protein
MPSQKARNPTKQNNLQRNKHGKLNQQICTQIPQRTQSYILPSLWKFTLPYHSSSNFPQNSLPNVLLYTGLASMLNVISDAPKTVNRRAQNKAAGTTGPLEIFSSICCSLQYILSSHNTWGVIFSATV